jgi:hypothetical protein
LIQSNGKSSIAFPATIRRHGILPMKLGAYILPSGGNEDIDVLQPQKTSLDAGLHQPNAVRAKLVCGTVEGCRIMSVLRDTELRGKVCTQSSQDYLPECTLHH